MIELFYDRYKKQWFHQAKSERFTWGATDEPLPYSSRQKNHLLKISLFENRSKVGPVIGILTSSKKGLPFIGNIKTFQRLIEHVQRKCGYAFVFTRSGIQGTSIVGFTYDPIKEQWIELLSPYPDFIYNRIPYPEFEATTEYVDVMAWINRYDIPFFNRSFLSKWETYLLLNQNRLLQPFLPDTKLATSKSTLQQMLDENQAVILKPSSRSKGSGVMRLQNTSNGKIQVFSNSGYEQYESLNGLWKTVWRDHRECIVQTYVERKTIANNPYDYRVLVQKYEGNWEVTGCGIRCAGSGKLTTHVPNGGRLLPIEFAPLNVVRLNRLVDKIGETLDDALGPIGEFSMDLGVDQQNRFWIFEINSKPMIFDEPQIQTEWEKRWYEQVLTITNFSHHDINPPSATHTNS